MVYSEFEIPIIRGTIFYNDIEYDATIGEGVQRILERYGYFPPNKIYADVLTRGRYIKYRPEMSQLMSEAYSKKGVFSVSMASGDSRKNPEYWKLDWNYTFYKNEKLARTPSFIPWNVLSLDSTTGRLEDPVEYNNYMQCFLELIGYIKPFYAMIDDVSNAVELLKKAKEPHFKPDYIQQIYWGNYFGGRHVQHYGKDKMMNLSAKCIYEIDEGVFFTLTDNVLTSAKNTQETVRTTIKHQLGLR